MIQQSVVEQAQAAAASQTGPAGVTEEAPLQGIDLITPDATEHDIPPPAYGDAIGEIHLEKDGFGTRASVTDDGRVNIRVNQLNRRLSQIFTPALRHHIQSAQDDQPPPPPYIPSSLGGEDGISPPPRLNVVIQVVGSRGDVQPFVALGKVLKDTYGHRVRLATHPNFKDFVQENGLEFFSIGGDPSQLMAFMVKNPGLMPGFCSVLSGDVGQRRSDVAEYIQGCWRSCYKAGDGITEPSDDDSSSDSAARPFVADCIIANPPSFAHIHCAEKLGINLHIMFTMPYSPTQAFPHPLANVQSNADPQLTNYLSYAMIGVLSWQGLGDIINRFRAKCLGLDPVSLIWAPGMLQRLKIPHTYCWSPALIPKPKDWSSHISISGFFKLESDYAPGADLQRFLDAGPPPVYVGFGSIVLGNPNAMTELIFGAVRKTGQRVLLSKGWGGMGADQLLHRTPGGVFMLGNVPHDWLFKHVSCVVHHGGAGTTAAGIAAGRPTLVVPFFGDQPFWGDMIARAGAGPDPIPYEQLTVEKLVNAINFCLRPESLERAKELAKKIAAERGCDVGAQSFHQFLEVDRLRCVLAPSRAAVWRIRRTRVNLSAFAACTLANANLLDFHDLKLFRPKEYETDEGPWDPVSGFGAGVFGAFSNMVKGLAEMPSEAVKVLRIPTTRPQSGPSVMTLSKKSDALSSGPLSGNAREERQASIDSGETLNHVQRTPNLFKSPSRSSSFASGYDSVITPCQSNANQDVTDQNRLETRKDSASLKDHDMLRHNRAHAGKGFGRIVKASLQSPMNLSMGIAQGFRNTPKLWGDGTVRPQEQVSDLKSGIRAMSREFGFGFYDGVTGVVTQPWRGAQKEGAGGFLKGIGKGIGGLIAKPGAALFAIPSYMMKGVHKEVQKLFGSNVQNYIIASRAAQGYDEWSQSSDEEKKDVIDRWKLIQKHLKKKRNPVHNEMLKDLLDSKWNGGNVNGRQQDSRHAASSSQFADESGHHSANIIPSASAETLQSLGEQKYGSGIDGKSDVSLDDDDDEAHESGQKSSRFETMESLGAQQSHLFDHGHLAGTTQSTFQVQERREKITREKTEEEIVLEYVKKQTLLEAQHQRKGKERVVMDDEDEELQRAIKLSLQVS
ncbi:UDP-Glycosyltransferase/glycogen phosphorylase [Aureobasidium sp. EXF-12298]|nr:UDP-Glycosyltransferase/glycogen phosphorylase [Aureobasidium sp. EXF-12298]